MWNFLIFVMVNISLIGMISCGNPHEDYLIEASIREGYTHAPAGARSLPT